MTTPFVVLYAAFGGASSPAHRAQVQGPGARFYEAFLRRLRGFGYERFFLAVDVHRLPWMTDDDFRAAKVAAEEFVRTSGTPGRVYAFPEHVMGDAFEKRQAAEWLELFKLSDDDVVLSLDARACLMEASELSRLAAQVPPGTSTLYTTGGVLPWETACAYRFRYERDVRLAGAPVTSATTDSSAAAPSPLPFSIRFEPYGTFAEALDRLIAVGGETGGWTRADLASLWAESPALFRRHFCHVGVELTNDDNLPQRIRSPRRLAPNRPVGRMTRETWDAILASLPRGPLPVSIDLWDLGEPLLHPEAVDWIAAAAARGVRVDLRTNGTLIDETVAERLVASGVDAVFVRIDAATPATYGRVSGDAAFFEKATSGLARLLAAKRSRPLGPDGLRRPILAAELTECAETRDDADAFFERYDHRAAVAKELRVRLVREATEPEVLAELYATRDPLEYALYRHDTLYRGRVERPADQMWTPLHRFPCRQLLEGPYVLWDGSIVPCRVDVDGERVVGRVRDGLSSAWNGRLLGEVLSFHDRGCSSSDHFCSGCGEWYYPFT